MPPVRACSICSQDFLGPSSHPPTPELERSRHSSRGGPEQKSGLISGKDTSHHPTTKTRREEKEGGGNPSLSASHLRRSVQGPSSRCQRPKPASPTAWGLKLQTFQWAPSPSFPAEAGMRGAVPSETLIQLVLDAYTHSNNSSERELPAFSTANYRRQSLRMFCKLQRETAEVSVQSQRNVICALRGSPSNFS